VSPIQAAAPNFSHLKVLPLSFFFLKTKIKKRQQ